MINPGMIISERYEITDKVGSGGMADVYKAKDTRLNRFVAIKILKNEFSQDAKFVSKFKDEAQSVAGISNANIVNVYDVGEDDGLYYIVMELVEGITLKKFIEKKGSLEVSEAVGISIQIAQGIKAAHDNNIIHRDIKPQNIIISKQGKIKVTDFGIAKVASSNTITSNAMGSVHYISPEQARGGYSDQKSDIYSLGVTMYEMFAGHVPFEGDSTVSVALSHIKNEAEMLDEIDENIPHSIAKIVKKCMQKKPEMRYMSAQELIDDLKLSLDQPDGDYVHIVLPAAPNSNTKKITKDDMDKLKGVVKPEVNTDDVDVDDYKDDEIDPKLERIIKIVSGVVAVLLVAVVIAVILWFNGWLKLPNFFKNKESDKKVEATKSPDADETGIEVPDIVGKTLAEAEALLNDKGLGFKLEPMESDEDANKVLKQDPEAGEKIDEDERVTIYYSEGKEGIIVPDVVNLSKDEATKKVQELGLVVSGYSKQYNDSIAKGKALSTDPVAGSSVEKGSSVLIYISKGPKDKEVTVPNIVNTKEAVAAEKLADAGLVADTANVKYVYSSNVKEGYVVSQSISAGTKAKVGDKVSYTVSKGSETKETVSPSPSPKASEKAVNYTYTGTVKVTTNPFAEGEDPATIKLVLSQDGKSSTVWKGTLGYSDFPRSFTITGSSDNNGTVQVCKGDQVVSSYSVEFKKKAS
ncbi:MAG: Stk1 family PASTA domain-containing Ser/Thr kinase [Lachnospiraceae bacterium]|nr:Stk1 family PASTA domain-containing Ser/Thr kinase [Lachnospiraceae bacterium]